MRAAALLLLVAALAGCGSHKAASPEQVVRSWSASLNRNDNDAAAKLFAPGSEVVQTGMDVLRTHSDAVRWNAALPCGGTITSLQLQGKNQVLAVFALKNRPGHRCDGPGSDAAAIFEVRDGHIVLWHQTTVPAPDTTAI